MIKKVMNNKGVSLIEIVAGLPLTIILFVTMILAMMNFVKTYQETKLYLQLQEDVYNAIEIMRYGYVDKDVTQNEGLIGMTTAKSVKMTTPSFIEIRPVISNQTYVESYKAYFRINDDHQLEYEGFHGPSQHVGPIVIFPSTPRKKVGRDWQFEVLNFREVWSIDKTDAMGNPRVVRIKLEGQVRFREKQQGESVAEDKARNTKKCVMETKVYLANANL